MRKDDFDKLMAGAEDALAYAQGDRNRGVAHSVSAVDVAAIRKKLDLSQAQFVDKVQIRRLSILPLLADELSGLKDRGTTGRFRTCRRFDIRAAYTKY